MLRSLGSVVGFQIGGAGLSLVSLFFVTGVLNVDEVGRYFWFISAATLLSVLIQGGLPTTILKKYSMKSFGENLFGSEEMIGTFLIFGGCGFLGYVVATGLSYFGFESLSEIIWIVAIAMMIASLNVSDACLKASLRPVYAGAIFFFFRPAAYLSFLILFSLLVEDIAAWIFLFSYASGLLVAGVVMIWPVFKMKIPDFFDLGFVTPDFHHFQVSASKSMTGHLPVFIGGYVLPADFLAYLSVAMRVTGPVRFGLNASRGLFGARIVGSIRSKDRANAIDLFRRSRVSALIFGWVLSVVLAFVLSFLLLRQDGPFSEFSNHVLLWSLFGITALGHTFVSMFGPVQLVGVALGLESFIIKLNYSVLVGLALSLIITGIWGGVIGFSLAQSLVVIISAGILFFKVQRVLKVKIGPDFENMES